MISTLFRKIVGSRNERLIKEYNKIVNSINKLEPSMEALSDEELKAKTVQLKADLKKGLSLDDVLPQAFAVCREASKRVLNMRHFDVQLVGGMVLNAGKIAEMKTGEGKTLVATLAVYLNALTEKGVHVVTVNDYLAQRDSEWMGQLYEFLGLTVGVAISGQTPEQKKAAYNCDITYATNNELGFDHLRDNMALSLDMRVQRPLNFAVIDEVDSILIDEARTPLIISGQADDSSELYQQLNDIVPDLIRQEDEESEGDYYVDEKTKQVFLSEDGHSKIESILADKGLLAEGESLYASQNLAIFHHLNACVRAHACYQVNVDYIIANGDVVIVDPFTGRSMPGRRWSDGLHQAVEAKEKVAIQAENQTLASITFQNYFRQYDKLSGMTGTADTEAFEFQQIYKLEVVVIPTNRPLQRKDYPDQVFLNIPQKFKSIVEDIKDCYEREQPVLVGTTSIEVSELISKELDKEKIPHEVLNAKQHEREADIVANAGRPKAVTIATNMAGRGTDIILGGNLEKELEAKGDISEAEKDQIKEAWHARHRAILENGGLHIIGTERHESRRIDNQLRGRAGRQGDQGSSRFYLSLQDDLMRRFANEKVAGLMQRFGMQEDEAIEHPWISRAIENAQRKVEGHNFDMRKSLLDYDDVANEQRKFVYQWRDEILQEEDLNETLQDYRADVLNAVVDEYVPPMSLEEQWDIATLEGALEEKFDLKLPISDWLEDDHHMAEEELRTKLEQAMEQHYQAKVDKVGAESFHQFERNVLLQVVDMNWKEHLSNMDYLRQGIHLRGFGQKDPKREYKQESFAMFSSMLDEAKLEAISVVSKVQIQDAPPPPPAAPVNDLSTAQMNRVADELTGDEDLFSGRKIGRNELCPCGSGKKYKHCHGKLA